MMTFKSVAAIILCCLCFGVSVRCAHSQDGQVPVKFANKHVNNIAFSPIGRIIACGFEGSAYPADKNPAWVELRETRTGRLLHKLQAAFGRLNALAFSPDGRWVAVTVGTGGWRISERDLYEPNLYPTILGEAYLWDVKTGKLKQKLTVASGQVISIAFSPNNRYAVIGCGDATIRLWDFSTGKSKWVISGQGRQITSVDFSPDGKTIVTSTWDGTVKVWDANTGKLKRALTPRKSKSEGWISAAAFSPRGTMVAGAGDRLRLWDGQSGKMLGTFGSKGADVFNRLLFSPNGKLLATGSKWEGVTLWDVSKRKLLKRITTPSRAGFAFTPDGKYLASSNYSGDFNGGGPFETVIELHKL